MAATDATIGSYEFFDKVSLSYSLLSIGYWSNVLLTHPHRSFHSRRTLPTRSSLSHTPFLSLFLIPPPDLSNRPKTAMPETFPNSHYSKFFVVSHAFSNPMHSLTLPNSVRSRTLHYFIPLQITPKLFTQTNYGNFHNIVIIFRKKRQKKI